MKRIFVSSVQKEFARERKLLKRYISKNPAYKRLFETFVFEEDVVAADRTASEVYLDELRKCDIYVALIGNEYGYEDAEGVSPTEREYDEATKLGLKRLVFVRGRSNALRHPKEQTFLNKISDSVIRAKSDSSDEMLLEIYSSLEGLLVDSGAYRMGPFDAAICEAATLEDIDNNKVAWFVKRARKLRNADLDESMSIETVLTHLGLMNVKTGGITNAAILLFGINPQRFHISSEVKCVQWYGSERQKPMLSYQIYTGNLFDMADEAIAFILAKLDLHIGTREKGAEAPRKYDIPATAVSEAIINAIVHRDYASSGSVQVELFKDRLVVRNPGAINPALTKEDLFVAHPSFPNNNIIANQFYQTKYIEKFGTGFTDLVNDCERDGLPKPEIDDSHAGVELTIWRTNIHRDAQTTANKSQINQPTDADIMTQIMKFPQLSVADLANKLQIKPSSLRSKIDGYRKVEILKREGARKNGRWVVTPKFGGCTADGSILIKEYVEFDAKRDKDVLEKLQSIADERGLPLSTAANDIVLKELEECRKQKRTRRATRK